MATKIPAQQQSPSETQLLRTIRRRLPPQKRRRFHELIHKRQDETISPKELKELIRLTDRVERMTVERLECLLELARLRQTSLDDLMRELNIKAPPHV